MLVVVVRSIIERTMSTMIDKDKDRFEGTTIGPRDPCNVKNNFTKRHATFLDNSSIFIFQTGFSQRVNTRFNYII